MLPADGAYHRSLVKFLAVSATSLLIGTMHGMLQVLPPIRAWLDSIGSPFGGPGHMIDPLGSCAHQSGRRRRHVGHDVTYYLIADLERPADLLAALVKHSFWLMTLGVFGFYAVQMTFGIWEGNLMFHDARLARGASLVRRFGRHCGHGHGSGIHGLLRQRRAHDALPAAPAPDA
jgi:hypothetical protein